jgi:c-di-GMP-binding flagellar brake protein YcgR
MAQWLHKMFGALAGQGSSPEDVLHLLQIAQRSRARVGLEVVGSARPQNIIMTTFIEQVRDNDIVVSQPSIGGLTHPLAFNETLRLSFFAQGLHHTGQTRCLGRVKVPSGGGGKQMLFAYSLALPEQLTSEDRRREPRVSLSFEVNPEAHLYAPGSEGPVLGLIADVSMTGARISTPMPSAGIQPGQEIHLKALLPEPVGLVDEIVHVARVDADSRTGQNTIGVAFGRRIPGMAELIRGTQTQAQRLRRTA